MSAIDASHSARPRPNPPIPPLPAVGVVRCVDRGRLIALRSRLRTADAATADRIRNDYAALIERSTAAVTSRRASLPTPQFDDTLPIHGEAEHLVDLIRDHRVVIVAGETGSGKTTQLPKLALLAGQGAAGMIGCTQPRRIAARSVARRVAEELQTPLGERVGYQVRFDDRIGPSTAIKFMTDGILLAEAQADRWLNGYDTIIVDEAHERSLNIDFLLGLLKRLLEKRDDLKVIVTSATIDTARFSDFFDGAPIVEIPGRAYPVERRYRPLADRERDERNLNQSLGETLAEITREDGQGDVLVFLPGEREIRDAHRFLTEQRLRHTEILPLYARLSAKDQDRVFNPGVGRRVVLATNVAETSLTVPRIRYVIDAGTARVSRYSPRSKVQRLEIEPIARANAEQRAGRCGRIGPGICYRLYDEADFLARPEFADPEILRSSLANVILRMLALGLGDIDRFPFVDPPPERAIKEGLQQLSELQAVGVDNTLTAIGRQMARFPIDVQLSRMLVEAQKLSSLRELLAIVSFLGIQDPRERPHEVRQLADSRHAEYADARSDFLSAWKLWQAYDTAHADLGSSRLRAWCEDRFLNFMRMREWRELHRQLLGIIGEAGWTLARVSRDSHASDRHSGADERSGDKPRPAGADPSAAARNGSTRRADARRRGPSPLIASQSMPAQRRGDLATDQAERSHEPAQYEAIHRAVLAGLPTNVARKGEKGLYDGTRTRGFSIFPGSALAKSQPNWLLSLSVIVTSRVFAHVNARIEPEWLYDQAGHLLKRTVFEPHWDRDRGRAVAYEQAMLYGLVVHARKRVDFARTDPAGAREIMLVHGLAECDMNSRSDFVSLNAQVLSQAREQEAMQRRQGLVIEADARAQFFEPKVPANVASTRELDQWYRTLTKPEQRALLWQLDDLLVVDDRSGDFPRWIDLAGHRFDLDYRFEPGHEADGVTITVPLAWLNALPVARLDWLVPGLLTAKVAELIRTMPKVLRRHFVPAPDFARAFTEAEAPQNTTLTGVLARYLAKLGGLDVGIEHFAPSDIPPHLQMRVSLLDEHGVEFIASRDIADLQSKFGNRARRAFAARAAGDFAREGLTRFEPDELPDHVESEAGLRAWPAFVDRGDHVDLVVFETSADADGAHAAGIRRLLLLRLADLRRRAARQLPIDAKAQFGWASIGSLDALRADIVDHALTGLIADAASRPRSLAAFEALSADVGDGLIRAANQRALLISAALAALAQTSPTLSPPLMGFAVANFDDLRTQLKRLFPDDMGRSVTDARLADYPRYLKAMALRAERLQHDPRKDQLRMLVAQDFEARLGAIADRIDDQREWTALRWLIEELRVSLFAQELGTREPVSDKRIEKRLRALELVASF